MKFKAGNALHYDSTMLRCSYSNETCYKAKVLPVIQTIDSVEGYTTGGQLITVKGWGFNSDKINVKIDGIDCTVKSFNSDGFQCITGANPTPSTAS